MEPRQGGELIANRQSDGEGASGQVLLRNFKESPVFKGPRPITAARICVSADRSYLSLNRHEVFSAKKAQDHSG
jgi:hypothetical protein